METSRQTPFFKMPLEDFRKAISNNIPEYMEKERLRRAKLKARRERIIFIVLLLLLASTLFSCKAGLATNYKVATPEGNYYTEAVYLDYAKDSVFFVEFKRNGEIRRNGAFSIGEVVVTEKK